MQYQIQTAPVWDAYRENGCPLCRIYSARETRLVKQYLEENVMDPDFRTASNAVGFCESHITAMYAGQNKLGLALQLETRAAALADLIAKIPADKKSAKKIAENLRSHCGCVICSNLEEVMPRYFMTVAEMFDNEPDFPELFSAATHCVKHATALFDAAAHAGKNTARYLYALACGLKRDLKRTESELRAFADCFDFNAAGSRPDPTAIPRAIKLMITDKIDMPSRK